MKNTSLRWAFNSANVTKLPWADELRLLHEFGWPTAGVWYDEQIWQMDAKPAFQELARSIEFGYTKLR